jgi:hypothetical protein
MLPSSNFFQVLICEPVQVGGCIHGSVQSGQQQNQTSAKNVSMFLEATNPLQQVC